MRKTRSQALIHMLQLHNQYLRACRHQKLQDGAMVSYDELQVQKGERVKELSKEQTWQLCHPVKEGSGLEVEMSPPVETLL